MVITESLKKQSGYGWVLSQLSPVTPFGRGLARSPRWYGPGDESLLETELSNIEKAVELERTAHMTVSSLTMMLHVFRDPRNSLNRPDDAPMDEVELFEIKYFLLSLGNIINKYSKIPQFEGVAFTGQEALLDLLDPSGSRLPAFSIEDSYSAELAEIRRRKKDIEKQLRSAAGASAGRDSLLAARRKLTLREDELEMSVRVMLTERILAEKNVLLENMDMIGKLDCILAKAHMAKRFGCSRPEISEEKVIEGRDMTHPEVADALSKNDRNFTPISLKLRKGATVITGANMGGKSVALKTVTLNQLLMQTGFFSFAIFYKAPLFDSATLLLADNQSVERGLSSFGSEIMVLNQLLRDNKDRFFFLALDEFARGTNPHEGAGLARALVEYLEGISCISLMTTHYDGVSDYAGSHYQVAGLKDLSDEKNSDCIRGSEEDGNPLSRLAKMMDYRLIPAPPGTPCPQDAIRVCRMLDLDPDVLRIFSHK